MQWEFKQDEVDPVALRGTEHEELLQPVLGGALSRRYGPCGNDVLLSTRRGNGCPLPSGKADKARCAIRPKLRCETEAALRDRSCAMKPKQHLRSLC